MPASKKLHHLYKDQDIEFVYFSIDTNKEDWLSASKAEKIDSNAHNYLVLNHVASNLKNELKIDRIPRYLLYNKMGKLIDHEAPGPETKEIKEIFDKLL